MIGSPLQVSALVASATVATALPDPKGPEAIGWWIIIAVSVLVGADKVLDFVKKHLKEQPDPKATYLTIPNFEHIEKERKADRDKILKSLEKIEADLTESNRYQAKARQFIHRRQNAMEVALAFIAGRFETQGDHAAATAIQEKLKTEGNVHEP